MSPTRCLAASLLILGCTPATEPPPAPQAPAAPAKDPAQVARDVCRDVMVKTRACSDLYVPALVRTRARFDQPPGIAARFKAEGEEKLVAIAREEFKTDWSDAGIAAHCEKLAQMPDERRRWVVDREASCLPVAGDCAKFVECNVHLLEAKWTAGAPGAPSATPQGH